jgi:class 3 adenylate cyclase
MMEMSLSPAVQLAWQLGGDLAVRNGEPLIEPKHLLFGVCSLEKVISSGDQSWFSNPSEGALIRAESDRLRDLAQRHAFNLSSIRRAIRDSLKAQPSQVADDPRQRRVVGRSSAARHIFETAAEFSRDSEAHEVGLLVLLRALLESADQEISEATASSHYSFAAVLKQLESTNLRRAPPITGIIPRVTDLDDRLDRKQLPIEVTESVDANISSGAKGGSRDDRLTWLSEFTWQFGTQGELELLLQKASDQLVRLVSSCERVVILVRDVCDNEMLLKAHSPQSTTPRISMTSVRKAMEEKKASIWKRGEDLTRSQFNIETGMYAPLVVNSQSIGAICLDAAAASAYFSHEDLEIVTFFAHQLALAIANHELRLTLKQNADILERLLTNFSPQVRCRLVQRARMGRLMLGGEHSVVSILCSDIRGFTRLTAGMCADDVVAMLNEYFGALVECIFHYDGTVDKFVGDSILAVFGSPEADQQHDRKAVLAAVEMQQVMERISGSRQAKGQLTCQIGIGVHSGDVLHGFVGSPERMEFTVIGEAVNLAARYSDGAKGSEILISPEVYQRVWRIVDADQISIATKHEGTLSAYKVKRLHPGET